MKCEGSQDHGDVLTDSAEGHLNSPHIPTEREVASESSYSDAPFRLPRTASDNVVILEPLILTSAAKRRSSARVRSGGFVPR
jgi:hypothetical protein